MPRFSCNHCGACCSSHRVPVTIADLRRLEDQGVCLDEALEWLPPHAVDMEGEPESFVHVREGRFLLVLAHRVTDQGTACVFWHVGRCQVYGNRPATCRTYPFELDTPDPADDRVHLTVHPQVLCDRTTGIHGKAPPGAQSEDGVERGEIAALETKVLLEALAERQRELLQYVVDVTTWNRLQRRRRFAGRRLLTSRDFLDYLRARRTVTAGG